MNASDNVVYEALGFYVDNLCGSIFLGMARGEAVLYRDGTHPLTPVGKPPLLSLFYSRGKLEVTGIWKEGGGSGAFLLRMVPSEVKAESGGIIRMTFRPRDGGLVLVTLYGNRGLAGTLERAVRDCLKEEQKGERILSSMHPEGD